MLALLTVPLAIFILALEGVLVLSFIECSMPVLYRLERWCLAVLIGPIISAFILFLCGVLGVPMSLIAMLAVHVLLIITLYLLRFKRCGVHDVKKLFCDPNDPPLPSLSLNVQKWVRVGLYIVIGFMIIKILAGFYSLLVSPSYFDDSYNNWNMRAKVFFTHQSLLLDRPVADPFFFGGRVNTYPLGTYLTKVWIAHMAGGWSDAIVNIVHGVWFLSFIGLFHCALRRTTTALTAILGPVVLVSMPLILVHGTSAYVDLYLAAVLFYALYSLYMFVETRTHSWLVICSLCCACLIFLKNEALLLYVPPIVLLLGWSLYTWLQSGQYSKQVVCKALCLFALIVAVVAVPWIGFKTFYGLTFGNAKGVTGFALTPHAGVPSAVYNGLMYTGSFLIFFPLFVMVLVLSFRHWLHTPLRLLVAFVAIVFVGQFFIYYLTPVYNEALNHTGFSRGVLQWIPVALYAGIVLTEKILHPSKD